MARIALTATPDPLVSFRFQLGDLVRTRSTGRQGWIVGGRYHGPVPTAGAFYAISYTAHPERGLDFFALEVAHERWRPSP